MHLHLVKIFDMSENFQQKATGSMTYPRRGTVNRLFFKTPLFWWRMGLGPLLSHPMLAGNMMLLLTTWGRSSKLPRHTMLSCVQCGDNVYVCSGWGASTDWYKNTMANANVTVQRGNRVYSARARRVQDKEEFSKIADHMFQSGGDSHFKDWLTSLDIDYDVNDLIKKRDRVYYVALDTGGDEAPPPMSVDLRWIWVALVFASIGGWTLLVN